MTHVPFRLALAFAALAAFLPVAASGQSSAPQPPLLLRSPSLSQDRIAFRYAGDVWTVSRQGGVAERLTAVGTVAAGPYFSPDGSQIAYTAHLHGGFDVYVVPSSGGISRRITWHPAGSIVAGWSPDGKDVLDRQRPGQPPPFRQTVSRPRRRLRNPRATPAAHGDRRLVLARRPVHRLSAHHQVGRGMEAVPRRPDHPYLDREPEDARPRQGAARKFHRLEPGLGRATPVYFLSDRNGAISLFVYDQSTKEVKEVVHNTGYDLKSFQAGPGGLVYEQFGSIHFVDTASGADHVVSDYHPRRPLAIWPRTSPRSRPKKSRTPRSRPPAHAQSSRRTAKSSPCPLKKATPAT